MRADFSSRENRADVLVEVCIALVNLSLGLVRGVSGIIWREEGSYAIWCVKGWLHGVGFGCRLLRVAVYLKSRDDGVIL